MEVVIELDSVFFLFEVWLVQSAQGRVLNYSIVCVDCSSLREAVEGGVAMSVVRAAEGVEGHSKIYKYKFLVED